MNRQSQSSRILIIEDEAIVAADLEDRLRNLGYIVVGTASSGREALDLAASGKPDIVLSDIMIKGDMDGAQTAVYLRKDFNIPVIFLSAYSSDSVLERAKISAPFGYLLKPFEERELQITIEMGLYKHKMEQEREDLVKQLQDALAKVRILSGLMPICSYCKKIRDDRGYWGAVETFVSENTDIRFSHGLCPDCARVLYPSLTNDFAAG
jgi:CheY-like chemotaxis protein